MYFTYISLCRYAVKFSIDQMLLGEATSHAEIQEYLEEYDSHWYIGTEKDKEWNESIVTGKPQLFSLAYDVDKVILTSSRFLCYSPHHNRKVRE